MIGRLVSASFGGLNPIVQSCVADVSSVCFGRRKATRPKASRFDFLLRGNDLSFAFRQVVETAHDRRSFDGARTDSSGFKHFPKGIVGSRVAKNFHYLWRAVWFGRGAHTPAILISHPRDGVADDVVSRTKRARKAGQSSG